MIKLILLRFLDSYFRHRWLYLLPILLMLSVGGFYFYNTPRQYLTQSTIYVQKRSMLSSLTSVNNPGFTWATPSQVATSEVKELIQTDSFVRAVIQKTDLEANMSHGPAEVDTTFQKVRKSLWVVPAGDNQIVIGAVYATPQVAVQLVQGVFDTYLNWKINSANADTAVAQNFFTSLVPAYKNNLEAIRQQLTEYLLQHPEPLRGNRPGVEQVQIDRIQSDLQLASARYADALNKLENAKLAASQNESDVRQTYTMVDAPILPNKPATSLKKMALNGLIFVLVGFLVSIGTVFGISVLDRSFRFPIDVQNRVGLQVLAMVPDGGNRQTLMASRKSKVKSNRKGKAKELEMGRVMQEERILPPIERPNPRDVDPEVNA